tara:strand:- start:653 stop:865 length:213 start_codon:yes stop_codon:yes gene_type:complete
MLYFEPYLIHQKRISIAQLSFQPKVFNNNTFSNASISIARCFGNRFGCQHNEEELTTVMPFNTVNFVQIY